MKNLKGFLETARTTETYENVERLPLSAKIQNGFITISDKGIVRFYSIFDNSESQIKDTLRRQQVEVEKELQNTSNEIYKEELESLNIQLSSMVRHATKSDSLREYGIALDSTEQLKEMVKEIITADKKTIGGIVYLLGGPLEIDGNTIQKSQSKYHWFRLFTREKKDNPKKGLVKNKSDGTVVSLSDYLDNPDYKTEDYDREPSEDVAQEERSFQEYLRRKGGL